MRCLLISREVAREALLSIQPFAYPRLPGERGMWPDEPEVDLTVIVPCYGTEGFLGRCLDSIVGQETDYSFEVVAVDDGSPDRCGLIIDGYAAADARVVPVHQENRGFSGARNRGIEVARGGALMFVDSDDELEPGAIQAPMSAYAEGGCDMVTSTRTGSSRRLSDGVGSWSSGWTRACTGRR